jgi:hypothetical protein
MVNPASIYRLTACTEEVAKRELNERRPRAIAVVKLPEGYRKRLENDCPDEEDVEVAQVGDEEEF